MELSPRDGRHHPYIGSAADYVFRNRRAASVSDRRVPDNIALPFQFSSHRVGEVPRAGPYGAFLGNAYYLVRVRTTRSNFSEKLPIIPGMTAEVDVLTGQKTVLAYLLKPVLKVKAYALKER